MKKKLQVISIFFIAIVVIVAGVYIYTRNSGSASAAAASESTALSASEISTLIQDLDGQPMRERVPNISLSNFDGEKKELNEYLDRNKTLFLTVWVSWCKYCQIEEPHLVSMIQKLKGNPNIAFLGISIDTEKNEALAFMKKNNIPYPVLNDPEGAVIKRSQILSIQGTPSAFIISPDGYVLGRFSGYKNWDDPAVIQNLTKLVNGL